jgi:hypothetical protein
MKQKMINAIDWCAAMWWHGWTTLADKARPLGYAVACRARYALDGDAEPCAACEEPGGTHIDCDFPAAGRMTRAERAQAFGKR